MFYIPFLVIDLVLAYVWFRFFKQHRKAWRERIPGWRIIWVILAALLMLFTGLLLVGLIVLTVMMMPDTATENFQGMAFIMIWVAGLFIYGFGLMFIQFLHIAARAAYEEFFR